MSRRVARVVRVGACATLAALALSAADLLGCDPDRRQVEHFAQRGPSRARIAETR